MSEQEEFDEEFDEEAMDVDLSQNAADDDVSDDVSDGEDSGDSDIEAEVQLYQKYADILEQIFAQTKVYDNYVELINVAHQIDLDKIRESHELFSKQFPMDPKIWLKWLQIELSIATSDDEMQRLNGLLKKALADYFSVEIGGLHSQLASKMPKSPGIWNEVLSTYGMDCMEGSVFFKDWRIFYTKYTPDSPTKIKKLFEVFTYELSLPLAGVQETYAEFCEFADKHAEVEGYTLDWASVNESYHKSKEHLCTMLKYENDLVSLDDKEHHKRAAVYLEYIEKCKSFLSEEMVQILYERMVTACCLNANCWLKYIKYITYRKTVLERSEHSQVFKQVPLDLVNRGLRNCTWSADLFIEKIRLAEKANLPKSDVTKIVEEAFEATSTDPKGYLNVWVEYLSYIKRNTNISDEEEVKILRKTMEFGAESLASSECDANSEFDRLCARIEYGPLQNGENGYEHYEKAIKNPNNHNRAILWVEFAHLDSIRGVDAARRIYRRAIKLKNIDDFDMVMLSWKSFEYAYGTSDQIRDCTELCDKIIENYNKTIAIKNVKAQKRKPDSEAEPKIAEKKQKTTDTAKPNPFKNKAESKKPETKAQPKPQPKPQEPEKVEPEFGEKDDVSIFLSNLAYEVTKDDIIAAFPELNIKDVTLIMGPGGRSKGYGYVELSNKFEVEKAVTFDRRPIGNRPAFIKKVERDKATRSTHKYAETKELNKVFIKGLPFDTSKDELQVLFGTFGTIKDIRMVIRNGGKFKGLAFVDYETEKSASQAVETMNAFVLRGMTLMVVISDPSARAETPKVSSFKPSVLLGSRAPVARGDAKPRLTFIPTSVQRSVAKPSTSSSSNGTNSANSTTPKSNDYFRQLINKK